MIFNITEIHIHITILTCKNCKIMLPTCMKKYNEIMCILKLIAQSYIIRYI